MAQFALVRDDEEVILAFERVERERDRLPTCALALPWRGTLIGIEALGALPTAR